MSPTGPISPAPSPAAARPAATARWSLTTHLAVVSVLFVLLLQPMRVMSQGQQCVEIDFDAEVTANPSRPPNLCKGIGKLRVPSSLPPKFIDPFLQASVVANNASAVSEAHGLLNNTSLDRINTLLSRFMMTPQGVRGWGRSFAQCEPRGLHGRWYRALTCSTIVQMSNICSAQAPRPLLCPKEIKEAFATWQQAFAHPSNNCPPEWATVFSAATANSRLLRDSKSDSCFPGYAVEQEAFCGFPTLSQACANTCRKPAFIERVASRLPGVPIDQACRQLMAQSENTLPPINIEPVPFIEEADSKGSSGVASGPTGTGSRDGSGSGSPTIPGTFPSETQDPSAVGFMDRPIAGVAGKFWVIGGVGIIGVAVILVGVVLIRRRTAASMAAKSRNMRFEESGSAPRDSAFGEKPPALALGTLTSSRVPQQGPTSPTNEYGSYNGHNNAQHPQQQQHYSNDRKDFFPPSPTQDHFRHPRSPSPPPPHAAHAQGGWQGPYQDAYGSVAPPPPPPPPLAKDSRPETWNKIAQRDSTRPPSMMPRDPVYPRTAILSYMPRLEDELEVHVGDQVAVWEDYADGYAWGETMDGRQGVFPIMCLADPNVPQQQPPMQQQSLPMQQQGGGEPLRDMQEGGVRETMVNPQAYRFTQYTVASDMSDDDVAEYRGDAPQHQQPPPMSQQAYQQQQYAQQPQQYYGGQPQGHGQQQRW